MTLHLALTFLAYVALGIISDILIVRYYQAISGRQAILASGLGFVIPLLSFVVLERTLSTHNAIYIFAFCAGNAVGTFYQVRKKNE